MDWSRKWIARMLGIAERRPFPKFSRTRIKPDLEPGRTNSVIFLSDVFSHYIEPEVEESAIEILNALGYRVEILPVIGAGASLLSKGFLQAARKHAEKVLGEIHRLDGGAGLSVVGCEPPEVYCLKREYQFLLPERRAEVESLSKRVWLADEFVLRAVNSGSLGKLRFAGTRDAKKAVFHPHCHQRAEGLSDDGLPVGAAATVSMLKLFGFEVDVIEAGCCGMAGTFGYDAGHYDLSMQVGELGVLPKVRQSQGENHKSHIVSTGAACRMQIRHGAGIRACHPLELVRDALDDPR
jgi:Fe-S oxidoreductase